MSSQSEGNVQEPDLFALLRPLEGPPPPEEPPISPPPEGSQFSPPEEEPDLPAKKPSQPSGLPTFPEKKSTPIVKSGPKEAPKEAPIQYHAHIWGFQDLMKCFLADSFVEV